MSISTPSGEPKSPSVIKVGGKPAAKPSAKPGAKSSGTKAPGKSGGSRKTLAPVKVSGGRNWGPTILFIVVGLVAVGIIGFAAWPAFGPTGAAYSWSTRAGNISGIVNFRDNGTALNNQHKFGSLPYGQTPPVGGDHNPIWQQCSGNVYDQPIPNEHAVHSLEHGAVWIAYRPDLPADQVEVLASKVQGKEFTMMSPFEGLDAAVSLQAWGYQLKLNNVNDSRIDSFISALSKNATMEPGAACSSGNTAVGTAPLTEQQVQQMQQGGMQ